MHDTLNELNISQKRTTQLGLELQSKGSVLITVVHGSGRPAGRVDPLVGSGRKWTTYS